MAVDKEPNNDREDHDPCDDLTNSEGTNARGFWCGVIRCVGVITRAGAGAGARGCRVFVDPFVGLDVVEECIG